jgi:hypothetical protein
MPQPPHFKVTLTRTNLPVPADVACTLSARMTSTVKGWKWGEAPVGWNGGNKSILVKTGDVSGEPFMSVSQSIAPLAPGQSATYDLWLTKANVWFEPDNKNWKVKQYYNWYGSFNHAWVLLQKGATVTGEISGNCVSAKEVTQVLTGDASQ